MAKITCKIKNILSFQPNTVLTGKEIKNWIKYNTENSTSHSKIAKRMIGYLETLEDTAKYILYKEQYKSCASYGDYLVKRVK